MAHAARGCFAPSSRPPAALLQGRRARAAGSLLAHGAALGHGVVHEEEEGVDVRGRHRPAAGGRGAASAQHALLGLQRP
jgi:hypothetical protein